MADHRSQARVEAFIVRFQAGEEQQMVSEGVAPLLRAWPLC